MRTLFLVPRKGVRNDSNFVAEQQIFLSKNFLYSVPASDLFHLKLIKHMSKASLFLLLVFLNVGFLYGQNPVDSPTISIQRSAIKVGDLLKEITRQSGVDFSFNSQLIDREKKIAFSIKNTSLEDALKQLCEKLGLKYLMIEGQIVLTADKSAKKKEQTISLSGFLSDKSSGEILIGAAVAVSGTTMGTYTNEFGYYSLSLQPGTYTVKYGHIGYEKQERQIVLNTRQQRDIALPTKSYQLPAVVINPSLEDILSKNQLGEMELSPDELKNRPEFLGESGLVKGLQSLPGIKTQSDGTAFFYTRGGERDQNLIIIDDAPIYNPSHLFGIYSMVIPDFAKSIKVYKSDMPAMVGDRLSSIVSIRTKDGNLNKFQFSGAISPFINRFSFETPIIKKRSSILATFRRSNFEWLYKRRNPEADIHFTDFHFKWNFKINDKNKLFFTTIWGADFFQNVDAETKERTGINWANLAATFRWNHIFSPKLFSNTTLYTGNYAYRLSIPPNYWKSDLGMLGLKSDFTHYTNPKFTGKFGLDLQGYFNTPGSLSLDTTISILPEVTPNYARKTVLYYEGQWKIRPKIQLNAGLRMISWTNLGPQTYYTFDDAYEVNDTIQAVEGVYNRYINIDPRISLQFQLGNTSQVKLSYGNYHQYLQLISNSVSPFTSLEVWLPANPNIKPQAARQWSLSFLTHLQQAKMEISAAAYHKTLQNQIDYEAHATTHLNPLVEGELRFGTAEAYGIEFLLKKDFKKLNGTLGYTYSRAFRQIDGINNDEIYPALQDRPHDFSLSLNYQWTPRLLCAAYWTSFSGATFTSPTGFFNFNGQNIPIYGARNNDRLPTYHRLDIALKFLLNKREDFPYQHNLTFSVYNALGHKNVSLVRFNRIPDGDFSFVVKSNVLSEVQPQPSQVLLGRFLPSLTYKFQF